MSGEDLLKVGSLFFRELVGCCVGVDGLAFPLEFALAVMAGTSVACAAGGLTAPLPSTRGLWSLLKLSSNALPVEEAWDALFPDAGSQGQWLMSFNDTVEDRLRPCTSWAGF